MRSELMAAGLVVLLAGVGMSAPAPAALKKAEEALREELALPPPGPPPLFRAKAAVLDLKGTSLDRYADRGSPLSPVRRAIRKAHVALWVSSPLLAPAGLRGEVQAVRQRLKIDPGVLKVRYPVPPAKQEARLKQELLAANKQLARVVAHLEDVLEELQRTEGQRDRDGPRWQAHHDLLHAWVLARLTALEEQALALGTMRKELPPCDPTRHTGWYLVPRKDLLDIPGRKRQKTIEKLFERLRKEHAGTAWAELARRGQAAELGCTWEAVP